MPGYDSIFFLSSIASDICNIKRTLLSHCPNWNKSLGLFSKNVNQENKSRLLFIVERTFSGFIQKNGNISFLVGTAWPIQDLFSRNVLWLLFSFSFSSVLFFFFWPNCEIVCIGLFLGVANKNASHGDVTVWGALCDLDRF